MNPPDEYLRLRAKAKLAKKDPALRKDLAREISVYVVAVLRTLGLSDGALCAWTKIKGFERYASELPQYEDGGAYTTLIDGMWRLAREAGLVYTQETRFHGWRQRFSSEALAKAHQSVVWSTTRAFRMEFERLTNEKTPKKPEVIFYEPPQGSLPPIPRHWV